MLTSVLFLNTRTVLLKDSVAFQDTEKPELPLEAISGFKIKEKKRYKVKKVGLECRIIDGHLKQMQAVSMLNTLLNTLFKFPASHLSGFKPSRKLVTADFGRSTDQVSDFKCIGYRYAATMKNSIGGSRFVGFTFGTPTRERRFTTTIVIVSALSAHKPILPFLISNYFQALPG